MLIDHLQHPVSRARLALQSQRVSVAYVAMRLCASFTLMTSFVAVSVSGQTIDVVKGAKQPSATPSVSATTEYRPILLGQGPNSLVNRIDAAALVKNGQKDAMVMFNCLVSKTGKMVVSAFYRSSPNSALLEQEVKRRLVDAVFVPGIYKQKPVEALYYCTVSFVVVEGKPRLRVFSNQEYPELKQESDFVGPQPIFGGESGFVGVHYPPAAAAQVPVNGIADIRVKIDEKGEIQLMSVAGEHPPLIGFGAQALMDLYGTKFIPAFRNGKPVACDVTLPIYFPAPL